LTALLGGFASLACVACEQGHRIARRFSVRCVCVVFAVIVNVAVLLGLRGLFNAAPVVAQWLICCWLLIQPLAVLWLPLRLWGEPDL